MAWWNQAQLFSRIAFSRSGHLRMLVQFLAYINQPVWHLAAAVTLFLFLLHKRFQGFESLAAGFVMGGIAAGLIRLWLAR